jgi:hypothetical protein
MAARENQGLQITLIIFVMLTIVLGVTTYVFFSKYQETEKKAAASLADRDKAKQDANTTGEEFGKLKEIVGAARADRIDALEKLFGEDMKKYAAGYADEVKSYHALVETMGKTIDGKKTELANAKAAIAKLEGDFALREAGKQPQIDKFKQEAEKAGKDLEGEINTFKADRARIAKSESKLKADLETMRKQSAAEKAKMEAKVTEVEDQGKKLKAVNSRLAEEKEALTSVKFDVPDGEIRWVNQRNGLVWINLGRADSLSRQVTFGVYPADVSDLAGGGRKASIEVTQVLGDHLAEARILDDRIVDPIIPGDKIFTPIWAPGEKRHFALAGHLDLDGDRKSDVLAVIDLIKMNGGIVDCYLDDKGKEVGKMTPNTRYLVVGDAANETNQSDMLTAVTKMLNDAKLLGAQKVQLPDLLQRMGWKSPNAKTDSDSRNAASAKPGEGTQKKSTGNVSETFEPRSAPMHVPFSTR